MTLDESQAAITEDCDRVKALLLEKNRAYGNAALEPMRIFSKSGPAEQIAVRIDDKLSRIAHTGFETADEDTVLDLIGYLHLLRIARAQRTEVAQGDTTAFTCPCAGDEGVPYCGACRAAGCPVDGKCAAVVDGRTTCWGIPF